MGNRLGFVALVGMAWAGCGDPPAAMDAGIPDAGMPDSGPAYTCASPIPLSAGLEETVSVMLDTTMVDEQPRDLGLRCGNAEAELRWAPQQVVALTVPGSGPVAIEFDTVNEDTTDNMIVIVQARRECERVPEQVFPPVCFGPVSSTNGEWRSRGAVPAMGGEVLYFVVTGYSDPPTDRGLTDRGQVRIDFTVHANQAPTLDEAAVILVGTDVRVDLQGTDADGNARAVAISFYNAVGLLDLYGRGATMPADAQFFVRPDDPEPTGTSWAAGGWVRSNPTDMATQLGEYLVARAANRAQLIMLDAYNAVSEARMVDVVSAEIVGYGATCDAAHRCDVEFECTAGSCGASQAATSACAMATDVQMPTITDTAQTVSVNGTTPIGVSGNFAPLAGCVEPDEDNGPEGVYSVTVADVTFDLLLNTDTAVTGRADTFLYVRSDCVDPSSELDCNDNASSANPQSRLELRDLSPGTYTIFVEQVQPGMSGANHGLEVTARPVLATGASCDDAEVLNRCAAGPCASSVCP